MKACRPDEKERLEGLGRPKNSETRAAREGVKAYDDRGRRVTWK